MPSATTSDARIPMKLLASWQARSIHTPPQDLSVHVNLARQRGLSLPVVLGVLLVLVALVVGRGYWLWRSPPVYWQDHQQYLQRTTVQERLALAQSVERRILEEFNAVPVNSPASSNTSNVSNVSQGNDAVTALIGTVQPHVTKTVSLSIEEVNAWIDQRLKDWASNQGTSIPEYVTDPMVAIEGDNLVIAFKFDKPNLKQVVSAVTRIEIDKSQNDQAGQARIRIVKIKGGRLRIPAVKTLSQAVEKQAKSSSELADMASKITETFDGQIFDPVLKLNNQKIRIVSLQLKHEPRGIELSIKRDTS